MTKLRLLISWFVVTSLVLCTSLLVVRNKVIVCGETADCIFADGTTIKQRGVPLAMVENCESKPAFNGELSGTDYEPCDDYWATRVQNTAGNFIFFGAIVAVVFVLRSALWHNKSKRKH